MHDSDGSDVAEPVVWGIVVRKPDMHSLEPGLRVCAKYGGYGGGGFGYCRGEADDVSNDSVVGRLWGGGEKWETLV